MRIEPLGIHGAWVCEPLVHDDDRGRFLEWFRADLLADATGRSLEVQQANHSLSARGVTRGIHYADVPPGQAKLVYCPVGAVLDVVVDLRVGSPTFGALEYVQLGGEHCRTVFLAEGLGHGFCATQDQSSVVYLVSTTYNPAAERTINPLDADLAIRWPFDRGDLVLSDKDRDAPSLAQARRAGHLPQHVACEEFYASLGA